MRAWAHLGCTEEEKFHPQLISITLEFDFNFPPLGMRTDRLEDTLCYLRTVENIQILVQNKRFNLIEHLANSIYEVICDLVKEENQDLLALKVIVHKVALPVPGVHGGVSFSCSRSPQQREKT